MKRAWIKKTGLAIFATFACGAVMGQDLEITPGRSDVVPSQGLAASRIKFGSNLLRTPCNTCRYSDAGGYFVVGPDNCISPGTTQWLAVSFIAAATGVPDRISAAIILADAAACPTNKVRLSIYSDACYRTGPGKRLISGVATVPKAPCAFAVAQLGNAPTLTKGTKYWVVATTTAQQAGLDANWYGSNNAQVAFNLGTGWEQFSGGTPAFRVQGSATLLSDATPEASSPAFGSNLFVDPCTGCNYDSNAGGIDVRGPQNCTSPGETHWLAVPFIAAKSGVPSRISASIVLHNPAFCPKNKVTLSLYTDNCGLGPGTKLISGAATVPTAPCDLAVATLGNAPSLNKGTKYWVVATTTAAQAGLDANWYASNNAQLGVGPGWRQFSDGTPAFMVQ
jgi:hypothetical protein